MSNYYEDSKELLEKIEVNTRNGGGEESSTTLTPYLSLVTTSGTKTSGAQSVSFSNNGPGDVTVAGGTLPATRGVWFDAGIHRLGAIPYTVPSGTSLQIAQVR